MVHPRSQRRRHILHALRYRDYLRAWLEGLQLQPATTKAYASIARTRIMPALGGEPVERMRQSQVSSFLRRLDDTVSPVTASMTRAILRRSLTDALRLGLLTTEAAPRIPRSRVDYQHWQGWTPAEAAAFLAAVKADDDYALYRLTLHAGVKVSVLLTLRWADLRKGAIPRTPATAVLLGMHKRRQQMRRAARGALWMEHGLIFPNDVGDPRSIARFSRQFEQHCKDAGAPIITVYGLEHSRAEVSHA